MPDVFTFHNLTEQTEENHRRGTILVRYHSRMLIYERIIKIQEKFFLSEIIFMMGDLNHIS